MYIYVYNVWHIKCVMMIHSILDRIVHAKVVCVCVCVCVWKELKTVPSLNYHEQQFFVRYTFFFQKFFFNWHFFILMKNVHMATLNIYIHSFLKFFHTRTNIMLLGCFYSPPNKQKSNKQHYYILNQYLLYKTKKHTTTYNNNKL